MQESSYTLCTYYESKSAKTGNPLSGCMQIRATGRACRTGGPAVATPVPERVRGFLFRGRGIRITGSNRVASACINDASVLPPEELDAFTPTMHAMHAHQQR